MKRINRKIEIKIEGITTEPHPVTQEEETKIYGKAYVMKWDYGKTVIDEPDKVSGIEFYATKSTFGSRPLAGMDMAFITTREMDIMSALAKSYLAGIEQAPATTVVWDVGVEEAYHIVTNVTHNTVVENGRLLVFDTEEEAKAHLEGMKNANQLLVKKVLLTARNF